MSAIAPNERGGDGLLPHTPSRPQLVSANSTRGRNALIIERVTSATAVADPAPPTAEACAWPEPGFGIADPAIWKLIYVVLSRVIARSQSHSRGQATVLEMVLGKLAHLEMSEAGVVQPAPHPEIADGPWTSGRSVMKRLWQAEAITADRLDELWEEQVDEHGVHACLPLPVVTAFFRPEVWRVVASVLAWGPGETNRRLERLARREGKRRLTIETRAREKGEKLSASTVQGYLSAGRKLMTELVALRGSQYPAVQLDQWAVMPPRLTAEDANAEDADTNRGGPPRILLRRALALLDSNVRERMATAGGRKVCFRPMRNRAILGLLCLGLRLDAVCRLDVRDYDPSHRFPDGSIGPAIAVRPGKTIRRHKVRWKGLPGELAAWIEDWIAYSGRSIGQRHAVDSDGEPVRHRVSGELLPAPMFLGSRTRPDKRMEQMSIYSAIAGHHVTTERSSRPGKKQGQRALIPIGDNPYVGYSPHSYRHSVEQLAHQVGCEWINENEDEGRRITAQIMCDALLDHAMSGDRYGYKDASTPRGREKWARIAGLGVWEHLRGDRGARLGPDRERIAAAAERLATVETELKLVEAQIDALKGKKLALTENAASLSQARAARILVQVAHLDAHIDDRRDREKRLERDRSDALVELERARSRDSWIAIPDDLPDTDTEAMDEGESYDSAEPAPEPVRDWITPGEAALVYGVSVATMNRWLKGLMPRAYGDPRNPWESDSIPIDVRSPRRRRVLVGLVDRSKLLPRQNDYLDELLTRPPA